MNKKILLLLSFFSFLIASCSDFKQLTDDLSNKNVVQEEETEESGKISETEENSNDEKNINNDNESESKEKNESDSENTKTEQTSPKENYDSAEKNESQESSEESESESKNESSASVESPEITPEISPQIINEKDYEFRTIHKIGKDNECYIIVFMGDGFTQNEQEKFFEVATTTTKNLLKLEPFSSFRNQINVYAISTISNESGLSELWGDFKRDTYLQVARLGNNVKFGEEGGKRAIALKEKLEKTLENNATIGTIHVVCNFKDHFGASVNSLWSFSSLDENFPGGEPAIHELGHSIGNLGDEYNVKGEKPNTSEKKNDVPWKNFLGYKGIGVVHNDNQTAPDKYIPSNSCIMKDPGHSAFCEVCKHSLAVRMNSSLYRENPNPVYVAEPEITFPYKDINVRTIVQNLQEVERNLKFSIKVTDCYGNVHEIFGEYKLPALNSFDTEKSCLSITLSAKDLGFRFSSIEGQLIDSDTNEIFSTYKYQPKF